MNSAAGSSSNGSSINMSGVDSGEGKKKKGISKEYFIALIFNVANSNMIWKVTERPFLFKQKLYLTKHPLFSRPGLCTVWYDH